MLTDILMVYLAGTFIAASLLGIIDGHVGTGSYILAVVFWPWVLVSLVCAFSWGVGRKLGSDFRIAIKRRRER